MPINVTKVTRIVPCSPSWFVRPWRIVLVLTLFVSLTACVTLGKSELLGENDQFAVVLAGEGETYRQLATTFYRDAAQDWRISDANGGKPIQAGMVVTVPKVDNNRIGVWHDGYQTVPILSYHRFGAGHGRLSVSSEQFELQMRYLRDNGFRVIPLEAAAAFFRGERSVPKKSVVLTIDDGYQSVYHIAFPILARYGYPATVFIYSDYIGGGGLTWKQMKKMEQSGLVSFQAHSKTHANLTERQLGESIADYGARLRAEVSAPSEKLSTRMREPVFGYAYPFGAVNRPLVDELKRNGYELGVTVRRGGNPFFVFPYGLRRTMIYESDSLADFASALATYERNGG
jgi:peptidoglycan/xylan/chitin deacetylase (PgdA/CDA1 family)